MLLGNLYLLAEIVLYLHRSWFKQRVTTFVLWIIRLQVMVFTSHCANRYGWKWHCCWSRTYFRTLYFYCDCLIHNLPTDIAFQKISATIQEKLKSHSSTIMILEPNDVMAEQITQSNTLSIDKFEIQISPRRLRYLKFRSRTNHMRNGQCSASRIFWRPLSGTPQ